MRREWIIIKLLFKSDLGDGRRHSRKTGKEERERRWGEGRTTSGGQGENAYREVGERGKTRETEGVGQGEKREERKRKPGGSEIEQEINKNA